jgi:hypothetical protein
MSWRRRSSSSRSTTGHHTSASRHIIPVGLSFLRLLMSSTSFMKFGSLGGSLEWARTADLKARFCSTQTICGGSPESVYWSQRIDQLPGSIRYSLVSWLMDAIKNSMFILVALWLSRVERARMADVKHRSSRARVLFWVITRVGLLVTPHRPADRWYLLSSRFFGNWCHRNHSIKFGTLGGSLEWARMADVKARFEFGWSSKSVKSLQHLLYQVNFEHCILQTLG